jgi:outer membrane scaffolding protein for murein synthesis (MipA/OmpV family)
LADDDYNVRFFGVSANGQPAAVSTASMRGLQGLGINLNGNYRFSDSWSTTAIVQYTRRSTTRRQPDRRRSRR